MKDETKDILTGIVKTVTNDRQTNVRVEWRDMGRYAGEYDPDCRKVTLNTQLLAMSFEDARQTALHEAAHAIADQRDGYNGAHGAPWKRVMAELGVPPTRCHRMPLRSRLKTYTYACGCREVEFTAIRHKRANVAGYTCPTCKREFKHRPK